VPNTATAAAAGRLRAITERTLGIVRERPEDTD
jgi:hypothetical protein